ncbi:MAG: glutathione S-transferase, partial [Xanthomonadaceae bacterium]|nr:glutathione S-transferase [Xanthomonadaceae bacterium]
MDELYFAPGAASMLVHWLLLELDIPHALHLVDTAAGMQKSPTYLALNPNGVVPTLVHDGRPMFESAAIAMFLVDQHPSARLAPALDHPSRRDYLQWMFHMANAVQPSFRLWWYPHEAAGAEHAELVRSHVAPRIEAAWARIDAHLEQAGPYLLGESVSAAD